MNIASLHFGRRQVQPSALPSKRYEQFQQVLDAMPAISDIEALEANLLELPEQAKIIDINKLGNRFPSLGAIKPFAQQLREQVRQLKKIGLKVPNATSAEELANFLNDWLTVNQMRIQWPYQQSPYEMLGVSRNASKKEIIAAYKKAKATVKRSSMAEQKQAFRLARQAFDFVKDNTARSKYDFHSRLHMTASQKIANTWDLLKRGTSAWIFNRFGGNNTIGGAYARAYANQEKPAATQAGTKVKPKIIKPKALPNHRSIDPLKPQDEIIEVEIISTSSSPKLLSYDPTVGSLLELPPAPSSENNKTTAPRPEDEIIEGEILATSMRPKLLPHDPTVGSLLQLPPAPSSQNNKTTTPQDIVNPESSSVPQESNNKPPVAEKLPAKMTQQSLPFPVTLKDRLVDAVAFVKRLGRRKKPIQPIENTVSEKPRDAAGQLYINFDAPTTTATPPTTVSNKPLLVVPENSEMAAYAEAVLHPPQDSQLKIGILPESRPVHLSDVVQSDTKGSIALAPYQQASSPKPVTRNKVPNNSEMAAYTEAVINPQQYPELKIGISSESHPAKMAKPSTTLSNTPVPPTQANKPMTPTQKPIGNYYQFLGLAPNAKRHEIKDAIQKMASRLDKAHEKLIDPNGQQKQASQVIIQQLEQLQRVEKVLTRPSKRLRYDLLHSRTVRPAISEKRARKLKAKLKSQIASVRGSLPGKTLRQKYDNLRVVHRSLKAKGRPMERDDLFALKQFAMLKQLRFWFPQLFNRKK